MTFAVEAAKTATGLRILPRYSSSASGIGRPSKYFYVLFVRHSAKEARGTDSKAPHQEPATSAGSGSAPEAGHDLGTKVAAALRGSGMHDEDFTAMLLSKLEIATKERETERSRFFFESLIDSCTEVSALPSKTDVLRERYAQCLSRTLGHYEQTGSSVEDEGRLGEVIELLSSGALADRLGDIRSNYRQLAAWTHSQGLDVEVSGVSPSTMADLLVREFEDSGHWLESFAEEFCRRLPSVSLSKVLGVWNLAGQEAADGFGVSQETLGGWLEHGVPADHAEPLANLSAATDVLLHYLKANRIPAVVRRPADLLGGKSLMDLYSERDTVGILEACRSMFRFEDVHG